jgi:CheY-like chemotaxis protein
VIDTGGHELTVTVPSQLVYVNADSARLTQVVANILNNAAKYTGRKGAIAVSLENSAGDAVIRIRDNGRGIPAAMLDKVFEPFVQVNRTVDSSQGGLGIGLTLARQLVTLHGGSVEARSQGLDQGSEFIVTLPILAASPGGWPDGRPQPSSQDVSCVAPRRVLVVDDFEESAELLAALLRTLGHSATAIDKPEDAIQWVLAHRPDVVLLDIAMPGLDGYEIARRLREHIELDDLVLVALTGYGQEQDRRRAFDAGFNFHLVKPVSTETLLKLFSGLPERSEMAEVATAS